MPIFDPNDPFPLFPGHGDYPYREAQEHSKAVDEWLGIRTQELEARLAAGKRTEEQPGTRQELWIGLPTQTLLTPYSEIRGLLARLGPKPGETVVDLGAGYGRMGFVLARHYPEIRFIGYEFVEERVREGNRCLQTFTGTGTQPLIRANLASPDFTPGEAESYFLYDYGSREAIAKTLEDLRRIAGRRRITVVGRGRRSRDAIERGHPWLSQIVPPEHAAHFSIYRSS